MKTFALQWNLMIMKGYSLEDAEWSFSTEKPHFLTTPSIHFNVSHSMLNSSGVHFLLSHNSSNDNMSVRWNNSTYGEYDRPSIPSFNRMSLIKTILFGIFLLISVVGNTLTLVQVYRMRRRKSTINTLVFLLASADLMVSFFVMVTEMTWTITVQWLAGTFMCKLMKYLEVFGFYLSTYTVVIISLDRCCAILDPLRRNRAPDRVRAMIIVAWILSALFSIPQAIVFTVEKAPFAGIDYYQCVTFTILTQKWQEQLYAILTIITTFILPLLTMIIAYALIFLAITRTSKDFQEESSDVSRGHVRSQLLRKAKTKSLIMTTIIVVAFIVCWSPYYIFWLWHTFNTQSSQDNDSNAVGTWVFFFGMANSMVNPMIYGAFHICRSQRRPRTVQKPFPTQSRRATSNASMLPRSHSHSSSATSSRSKSSSDKTCSRNRSCSSSTANTALSARNNEYNETIEEKQRCLCDVYVRYYCNGSKLSWVSPHECSSV